jgi:hypothetical protein
MQMEDPAKACIACAGARSTDGCDVAFSVRFLETEVSGPCALHGANSASDWRHDETSRETPSGSSQTTTNRAVDTKAVGTHSLEEIIDHLDRRASKAVHACRACRSPSRGEPAAAPSQLHDDADVAVVVRQVLSGRSGAMKDLGPCSCRRWTISRSSWRGL